MATQRPPVRHDDAGDHAEKRRRQFRDQLPRRNGAAFHERVAPRQGKAPREEPEPQRSLENTIDVETVAELLRIAYRRDDVDDAADRGPPGEPSILFVDVQSQLDALQGSHQFGPLASTQRHETRLNDQPVTGRSAVTHRVEEQSRLRVSVADTDAHGGRIQEIVHYFVTRYVADQCGRNGQPNSARTTSRTVPRQVEAGQSRKNHQRSQGPIQIGHGCG